MIKSHKFTWEALKPFIFNELLKTNHIQTFGTIGSCNIEHDIDIMITKKPKSKPSDFLRETKKLISELNKYLNKKYNKKVVQFFEFNSQEEVLHIGKYKKGDLAIHLMEYFSLNHIFSHWFNIFKTRSELRNFIIKKYIPLFGDLKSILKKSFEKGIKNENLIWTLEKTTRFNSNYPKKLIINFIESSLYYVQKHSNNKMKFKINSIKDAENAFYKTIEILEN